MLVDIFNEPWSIFAHTEEISLLLGRLHLTAAVGTFSIHQLGRGPEGLAGSTIKALISALVDIALIIKLFKNLLNLSLVILICGADKLVIGGIHQIPDPADLSCGAVYKLLRRNACSLCLLLDLLSMLVRTGLEEYIIALCSFISCDTVSQHDLIGIADMGLTGGICNGCCNIIWFFTVLTHFIFLFFLDSGHSKRRALLPVLMV